MKIKNISKKIVTVAGTVLLPDADMPATDALKKNPAIKALIQAEQLMLIAEEKPAKAKADDKAKADAKADSKATQE